MTGPSLLIPCYNAAAFLPRLMEGVRAQTIPFAEILCYDDGSTDNTVAVALLLGLRILEGGVNRGVATARNRLAAAARSAWIHFHDADDLISPSYVERLAPWCTKDCDVVSCDADWIDDATRAPVIRWHYDAEALATHPHDYLLQHPMGMNSSIIRKSSWIEIGGCDESLAIWEDADVHIRLARSGAHFHHVPEVLTWSLRRPQSFSHDYRRNWLCRLQALEAYAAAPDAAALRAALGSETEKAAAALAGLGDRSGTARAVALCRRLGLSPPSSRHPLLRLLKSCLPTYTLLRWQQRRRNRAAS